MLVLLRQYMIRWPMKKKANEKKANKKQNKIVNNNKLINKKNTEHQYIIDALA